MPVGEPEYDEVIEEYEEEILVQEGAQEPVGADPADPAKKPRSLLVLTLLTRRLPKASPKA